MEDAWSEALSLLPPRLSKPVAQYARRERIAEVRLREGLPLSLTVLGQNRLIDEAGRLCPISRALCADPEEIRGVISRMCEGSLYRHTHTIERGYIVTARGLRAGLCTRAPSDESGRVHPSLADFSGVDLRIPYAVRGAASVLLEHFRQSGAQSVLVYSAPGVGKTTLLRDLALGLSNGAAGEIYRVCVIDERGELFPRQSPFLKEAGLLDVLGDLTKAEGIERATRLLAPQVIVCDEIGGADEPQVLAAARLSGVLFAASVHGSDLNEVQSRAQVRALIDGGVFDLACGITRGALGVPRLMIEEL